MYSPYFSFTRIGAMVLRYAYLLRSSWPRVVELAYWPTVQMILWGVFNQFLATQSSWVAQATGVLLGAVLLWDVLFRGQLGVSTAFIEEMYSRNLGHLFASPLRPVEMVMALLSISMIRTLIGLSFAALLAIPLYQFSIFSLGLPLLAFFTNLIVFGWSVGLLVCALILRNGLGAESLAWAVLFALAPISGIYYPVSALPEWAQWLAWALPSSHVFEGMREVMFSGTFNMTHFISSVALNIFYMLLCMLVFLKTFHMARRRGLLLQMGE